MISIVIFCLPTILPADVSPSGSYNTSVPLEVPPYHGLEPRLSLSYNSNRGNGWIGVGWTLAGFSVIQRASPARGAPRNDGTDEFYLDGLRLIACTPYTLSPSCTYPATPGLSPFTTQTETYARIAFDSSPVGGRWHTWSTNGRHTVYAPGVFTSSASSTSQVYNWYPQYIVDPLGHRVDFGYKFDGNPNSPDSAFLSNINYNGTNITFYSESRPDVVTVAAGDRLLALRYRLKTIDVNTSGRRARSYALQYSARSDGGRSFLSRFQQYGTDAVVDPTGTITGGTAAPALTLGGPSDSGSASWNPISTSLSDWSSRGSGQPPPSTFQNLVLPNDVLRTGNGSLFFHSGDIDGDGRSDWVSMRWSDDAKSVLFTTVFADPQLRMLSSGIVSASLPWPGLNDGYVPQDTYSWLMDVNGDGHPDLVFLTEAGTNQNDRGTGILHLSLQTALSTGHGMYVWATPNAQATAWEDRPSWFNSGSVNKQLHCQPGDLNGDGYVDLACTFIRGTGEHYIGTALSNGDGTFTVSESRLPFSSTDQFSQLTRPLAIGDTNGDGIADAMLLDYRDCIPGQTSSCHKTDLITGFYQSNGTYSFSRTPTNWTNGGTVLYSADLDGDGRADYISLMAVEQPDHPQPGAFQTARSQPGGTFALQEQTIPAELVAISGVTFGDADGDGKSDLLYTTKHAPHGSTACSGPIAYAHVLLTRVISNGDGTFRLPPTLGDCNYSKETSIAWGEQSVQVEVQAADTNGDGKADFLIAGRNEHSGIIRLYDDVTWHIPADSSTGPPDVTKWMIGDISGDGQPDFVYVDAIHDEAGLVTYHSYSLLTGADRTYIQASDQIDFGFGPDSPDNSHEVTRNWKLMDVDGDGKLDLVYMRPSYGSAGVVLLGWIVDTFFSQGNGKWRRAGSNYIPTDIPYADTPNWIPMDVNGDGRFDLVHVFPTTADSIPVLFNNSLTVQELLSNGDGSFQFFTNTYTNLPRTAYTTFWRPGDVNGDGKIDLIDISSTSPGSGMRFCRVLPRGCGLDIYTLISQGSGTWDVNYISIPRDPSDGWDDIQHFDDLAWRVMDVNGDGSADLVHLAAVPDGIRIHSLLSDGKGNWTQSWSNAPASSSFDDIVNWRAGDINGDGRTDLVHLVPDASGLLTTVLMSTGNGLWQSLPGQQVALPTPISTNMTRWRSADANADGRSDLVQFGVDAMGIHVSSLQSAAPQDLLTTIENGLGAVTTISYAPASQFSTNSTPEQGCSLPVGLTERVVSSIQIQDGHGTSTVDGIAYDCPHWSQSERTFLGWQLVTDSRAASVSTPATWGRVKYRYFDQGVVQPSEISSPIGSTSFTYYPIGQGPPFHSLLQSRTDRQCNQPSPCAVRSTSYTYDAFANVTSVHQFVGDTTTPGNEERITARTFSTRPIPYLVSLLTREEISVPYHGTQLDFSDSRFCYDGDSSQTCDRPGQLGLLSSSKINNQVAGHDVITRFEYDKFGNLTNIIDPNEHATSITFDPTFQVYPNKICNALSQCSTAEWDTANGTLKRTTDANGNSIVYGYDALGRISAVTYPNQGSALIHYLNLGDPQGQHVRMDFSDGSPEGLWIEQYLDGLGRFYRTSRKGESPGQTLSFNVEYADSSTRVYKQSQWFDAADNNSPAVYDIFMYDVAGRLIKQTHPDGSSNSWLFTNNADSTNVAFFDEQGHQSTVDMDVFGRVRRVGQVEGNQIYSWIDYGYTTLNNISTITNSAGNVTKYRWDNLGRRVQVDDPDLGTWTYVYDDAGNITRLTSGNGLTAGFSYDELNRLRTQEWGPDGPTTQWYYDESGHGAGIGRLTSVSDPTGTQCKTRRADEYTYDAEGNVVIHDKCVEGRLYESDFGFDPLGRPSSMTYPDGEAITYKYGPGGSVNSIPGYLEKVTYDPNGMITGLDFPNGISETMKYDLSRGWLTDQSVAHRTSTTQASVEGGNAAFPLFQAHYSLATDGLISGSSSVTHRMNRQFSYDELHRLKSVVGDINQSFDYNPIGNMVFNSGIGAYRYNNSGPGVPVRYPHSVRDIPTDRLNYDLSGNLTLLYGNPFRVDRHLTWDSENRLVHLQEGENETSYVYDWQNDRVQKSGNWGTIVSPTSFYRIENSKPKKYYYAGGLLIAKAEGGQKFWFHQDNLGSTRVITDQKGRAVSSFDYAPFGQSNSSGNPGVEEVQFGGHIADAESGLIYMDARYYDPNLGIFISPDSIVSDPLNPQAFDPYSYGYNNPISNVDPTGHQTEVSGQFDGGSYFSMGEAATWGEQFMSGWKSEYNQQTEMAQFVVGSPTAADANGHYASSPSAAANVFVTSSAFGEPPPSSEPWTDELGEFVLLGHKESAFGFSMPGYAWQHWWIKTPKLEVSMGPASADWGTEGKIPMSWLEVPLAVLMKVTDHNNFGDRDSPDVYHYFTKVHGPAGFTARVEKELTIGRPLGLIGPDNNCQTLCASVLLKADANPSEVPKSFSFGQALDTLLRHMQSDYDTWQFLLGKGPAPWSRYTGYR